MNYLKLVLILSLALGCSHQRFGLNSPDCPANLKSLVVEDTCWIPTKNIKPTQAVVGFDDLKLRKKKIDKQYSKGTLKNYLDQRTAPAVIAPTGHAYILDRHHLSKAISDAFIPDSEKKILIKIRENMSELSQEAFEKQMKGNNWVYLKKLAKPIAFNELPQNLDEMIDDPYRTLAGLARDLGAYKKTETPFLEFYWADLYRQEIELPNQMTAEDWRLKTHEALKLSKYKKPITP